MNFVKSGFALILRRLFEQPADLDPILLCLRSNECHMSTCPLYRRWKTLRLQTNCYSSPKTDQPKIVDDAAFSLMDCGVLVGYHHLIHNQCHQK